MPYETRYVVVEEIKPIQGDGGSRVKVPGRLNNVLKTYTQNNIDKSWSAIWR